MSLPRLLRPLVQPVASTSRLPFQPARGIFLSNGKIRRRFPSSKELAVLGSKGNRQERYERERDAMRPAFFKAPVDEEGLPYPAHRYHPYIPPNFRIVERCTPGMRPPPMRPERSGGIGKGGRTAVLKAQRRAHLRRVRRNKPSGVYA